MSQNNLNNRKKAIAKPCYNHENNIMKQCNILLGFNRFDLLQVKRDLCSSIIKLVYEGDLRFRILRN